MEDRDERREDHVYLHGLRWPTLLRGGGKGGIYSVLLESCFFDKYAFIRSTNGILPLYIGAVVFLTILPCPEENIPDPKSLSRYGRNRLNPLWRDRSEASGYLVQIVAIV